METKHTPGPWGRNIKPATHYPTIFDGRNTHVAVVQSQGISPDEVEANCDLITAAPELLEALEYAAMVLESYKETKVGMHSAAVDKCRAAIARAKGDR